MDYFLFILKNINFFNKTAVDLNKINVIVY